MIVEGFKGKAHKGYNDVLLGKRLWTDSWTLGDAGTINGEAPTSLYYIIFKGDAPGVVRGL